MRAKTLCLLAIVALVTGVLSAQSPMPVIVPAMTPATTVKPPAPSDNSGSLQTAVKLLQEMKTANEETLQKQTATLQQLDELEKAANEIRIYTKRS
jgi:hypothetical protein